MISEPRDRETGRCFEVTAVSRVGRGDEGKRQITGILHHESRLSLNVSHQVLSPHHQQLLAVIRTQSTHLLLYNRSLRNAWPGIVKLLSLAPG